MIRAFYELQEEASAMCPDEVDFQRMYDALGDRAAQDAIRADNPEGQHCLDLQVSPKACDGCPKNPVTGRKRDFEKLVEENGHLIDWAVTWGNYGDLGLLPDLTKIRPAQYLAAQIAQMYRRHAEAKQQGKLIAVELAKIVAPMFGAKMLGA